MATLSIIIPVYNAEKYLKRCLDSILVQSYQDYEILLIDDGSSDGSPSICDEYGLRFPNKIKVIHQKNSGVSASRNKGIEASQGKYLMFVDSDDALTKEFSETISFLDESVDLFCFSHDKIDENDELIQSGGNDGKIRNYDSIYDLTTPEDLYWPLDDNALCVVWAKIYRKDAIGEIRFQEELDLFEDGFFNRSLNLVRIRTIRKVVYKYRVMPKSLSHGLDFPPETILRVAKTFDSWYLSRFESNPKFHLTEIRLLYTALLNSLFRKKADKEILQEIHELLDKQYNLIDFSAISKKEKIQLSLAHKERYAILKTACKIKRLLKRCKIAKAFYSQICRVKKRLKQKKEYKEVERAIGSKIKSLEINSNVQPLTKEEKNIFVFWYDGFDEAPAVVRICIQRIESFYKNKFKIIKLDKNNMMEYASLPNEILKKFEENSITIQTFSDLLRLSLLERHGGIWIDCTLLFTKELDLEEILSELSFNSLHSLTTEKFLSYKGEKCFWTTFFLAGRKGNTICSLAKTLMIEYINSHKEIPYFLTDYTLLSLKRHHVDSNVLSKIKKLDGDILYLGKHMDDYVDDEKITECQKISQKLDWRLDVNKNPKKLGGHYFMDFEF